MSQRDGTDPQADLAVLNPPAITDTIGGREVTCREYGFIEELTLRPYSQPFIDDLVETLRGKDVSQREIDVLVVKHLDAVQVLVAQSADVTVAFIRTLNTRDGHRLLAMWWSANGPFFVRCAMDYALSQLVGEKVKTQMAAGQTFTPPSLPTGTHPTPSAGIPGAR